MNSSKKIHNPYRIRTIHSKISLPKTPSTSSCADDSLYTTSGKARRQRERLKSLFCGGSRLKQSTTRDRGPNTSEKTKDGKLQHTNSLTRSGRALDLERRRRQIQVQIRVESQGGSVNDNFGIQASRDVERRRVIDFLRSRRYASMVANPNRKGWWQVTSGKGDPGDNPDEGVGSEAFVRGWGRFREDVSRLVWFSSKGSQGEVTIVRGKLWKFGTTS